MDFIDKLTSLLPFTKKEEQSEYYFALNIGSEILSAALWSIDNKELKISAISSSRYSSLEDMVAVTDRLLDSILGSKQIEVQKILFGVSDSWLFEDNLKEEYLKHLKSLVKELELEPLAYVATSQALIHFLEKQEGIPSTCILIGFEEKFLKVTVARAGKLDGTKILERSDNIGLDIEKALLTFTTIETLPSKILLYDRLEKLDKLKNELVSFPWMSKLSFLHFPKIEICQEEIEIKSVCLAGASELKGDVVYKQELIPQSSVKPIKVEEESSKPSELTSDNLGFVVGDIAQKEFEPSEQLVHVSEDQASLPSEVVVEPSDFEPERDEATEEVKKKFSLKLLAFLTTLTKLLPKKFKNLYIPGLAVGVLLILLAAYLTLPQAKVLIYVDPKVLERDSQITADPGKKTIDENAKIIPGQAVEQEVSGSLKGPSSGKKEVGDPAKGTVVVYNKTYEAKSISKGMVLSSSGGFKFTLDNTITVASQSAQESGIVYGKATGSVTAVSIGADSNLPSGSDMTISGLSSQQVSAKAEGNFSGGTSKEVTVVSDEDQKRLLATLASDLRRQARQKLQERLSDKKILEEALLEEIVRKNFSKNVNDQATEFSLNLTARYKGTAFEDKDLKAIISKMVTLEVPQGFELNLSETETQADISKLEKDGKLIFLARFRAKLMPKLDIDNIKRQIKGKTPKEAGENLKNMENILDSDIAITPSFPKILQRLPILERNIKVEVGLK